jgi:non-heme chloroperoxidase
LERSFLKKITVQGDEFNYTEKGKGENVIFIHGSLNDYKTWKLQIEPFAEHYHVTAYSRRYHYPNKFKEPSVQYSAIHEAEDILLFLDALKIDKAHFIGSSYGAYSILFFALKYGDRIQSLVLVEPPIIPWLLNIEGGMPQYERFIDRGWIPARKAFESGNMEEGVRLFINGVSGDGYYESLNEKARKSLMLNAPELKLEALSDEIFPELKCEWLKNIKNPVLLLTAENSPSMFRMISERLHSCLPRSEIKTIHNASHGMHIQNADEYNSVVIEFISSLIR